MSATHKKNVYPHICSNDKNLGVTKGSVPAYHQTYKPHSIVITRGLLCYNKCPPSLFTTFPSYVMTSQHVLTVYTCSKGCVVNVTLIWWASLSNLQYMETRYIITLMHFMVIFEPDELQQAVKRVWKRTKKQVHGWKVYELCVCLMIILLTYCKTNNLSADEVTYSTIEMYLILGK